MKATNGATGTGGLAALAAIFAFAAGPGCFWDDDGGGRPAAQSHRGSLGSAPSSGHSGGRSSWGGGGGGSGGRGWSGGGGGGGTWNPAFGGGERGAEPRPPVVIGGGTEPRPPVAGVGGGGTEPRPSFGGGAAGGGVRGGEILPPAGGGERSHLPPGGGEPRPPIGGGGASGVTVGVEIVGSIPASGGPGSQPPGAEAGAAAEGGPGSRPPFAEGGGAPGSRPGAGRTPLASIRDRFYVGLQFVPAVASGGELEGVGTGLGGGVVLGYVFDSQNPSLDVALETSVQVDRHDDELSPGDSALAVRWLGGAKLLFLPGRPFRPYAAGGVGAYNVLFDSPLYPSSDDIHGGGGYVGGGADWFVAPNVAVGLDAKWHLWVGDDDNVPSRGGFVTDFVVTVGLTMYL